VFREAKFLWWCFGGRYDRSPSGYVRFTLNYGQSPRFTARKNRLQEAVLWLQRCIIQEVLDDVMLGFVCFDGVTFLL
jgi:hypothetical protein